MTTKTPTPELRWRDAGVVGMMATIGPFLSIKDENGRRFGLQTDDRHANPQGAIHGGTLASLLDQAIAYEAWCAVDRLPVVTVQMDTRFPNGARPGDFLEITAEVRQRTTSMVFADGTITCNDKTVATASAVLKIMRGGQDQ